jgi:myo-inositol 2-dehydrogenase/D-chiro-inositol 1-dehydrogenase
MGRAHLRALAGSDRVQIVAAVDPTASARAAAEGFGLPTFSTLDALLEEDAFDAALIAAPSGSHLEILRVLVRHRIPVLCEKPCGLTSGQCHEALELTRVGGVLRIGYWRRFVPDLIGLREQIRAGLLGEVYLVACSQWDEWPPAAAFRATSGGILIDMGVHELDMTRWLLGQDIVDGAAFASAVAVHPTVPQDSECLTIALRLSRGAIGTVSLGRRYAPGESHRVLVVGTAGVVDRRFVSPPSGEDTVFRALRAQAESFAGAVAGKPDSGATAEDALVALLAAERIGATIRYSPQRGDDGPGAASR